MADRKPISKKIRFEVFKRDSFTCQYCGKSAPSAVLEVDHIKPVSKDGEEDITNLITSCFDCNRGKSDRELSDDTVIVKRKAQLDELQIRREQLEMMVEWQRSLVDISEQEVDSAIEFANSFLEGYYLNENGAERIRKSVKKFGLAEILESTRISANQYLEKIDGKLTHQSVEKYCEYIHRIAASRKKISQKPYLSDLYRLKGYMKAKGFYINEYKVMHLLEKAYLLGYSIPTLEMVIKDSGNWTTWRETMEDLVDGE